MTKKDNIDVLDDGAPAKAKESVSGMQAFIKNIALIIEGNAIEARMIKIKYDSLLSVGFTKEQAIELCKK